MWGSARPMRAPESDSSPDRFRVTTQWRSRLTGMMDTLLLAKGDPLPVVLVVIVIFIVVMAISRSRARAQEATLRRLAMRIGGGVFDGGWFSEPALEFPIGSHTAHLEFFGGSKHSSPYTRVRVQVGRASPGILHILEQGFGQEFLKLFGAQDLEIGDLDFDKAYVIKATPSTLAARIFSRERRREGMRVVRSLRAFSHPTFDVDAEVVTVMVRQYLRDENDLLLLMDAAKDFLAFVLQPPPTADITLEEVIVRSGAECPVCGTAMTVGTVRCEACRTPHHAECWKYMGRCSTYACKGTRAA
jgi:hypothetical protein